MSRVVTPITLLVLSLLILTSFIGTPWEKRVFIKNAKVYLLDNYDLRMNIVSKPRYSYKSGTYSILASPLGMEHIRFAVYQNQGKKQEIVDSFDREYWTYEANTDLNEIISKTELAGESYGKFIILGGEKDAIGKTRGVPQPFTEVKDQLKKGTHIFIDVKRSFNFDELDREVDGLYKLLSLIREKQYYFETIQVVYADETIEQNINFQFEYEEFYASLTRQYLLDESSSKLKMSS